MEKTDRLRTELNKNWAVSNDFVQFIKGFDNFSELLRGLDPEAVSELVKHLQSMERMKKLLNKRALSYLLQRASSKNGDQSSVEAFYKFADALIENHCMIEQDQKTVSYLAYQGAMKQSDSAHSTLQNKPGLDEATTARKLKRTFEKFDKKNKNRFFSSLLNDTNETTPTFDALCAVHHQIVDNIDHWMDFPNNPNRNESNGHLFGDTLVFRVSRLSFSDHQPNASSKIDPSLRKHLLQTIKSKNLGAQNFWSVEYYDNGRGIIENLRRFGTFKKDSFSLLEAIEKKMSTRAPSGGNKRLGEGYSTIIEEASDAGGFVSLRSGGERIDFSSFAPGELEHSYSDDFSFGTYLNIVFPG